MPLQFALAASIMAGAWLVLRRQAGGGSNLALLWLDVSPLVLGWLVLLSVSARPVLSAAGIAAGAAGLALADAAKRATLHEPLVFADRAELLEVVRHPGLYLPFAGPGRVAGGLTVAALALAGLVWLEPAAAHPSPIGMLMVTVALVFLPTRRPVLGRVAALYRSSGLTGDPVADMRRFGFLASLVMQATVAREERGARQAAVTAFPSVAALPTGPVVMVQIESFFDARRLGPGIPVDLLPAFDRLCRGAMQAGRLDVPCWGANTVRSEFAALTGIGQGALGLDRFNPYERFARRRLRSVAWEMKRRGYRTICLHPFDRRFYGRDRVMPMLGFDEFHGGEAFAGAARTRGYVTDEAVAEAVLRVIAGAGPRVFVFAMTMANHGPWGDAAGGAPLRTFLAGLRGSDAMLAMLMTGLPRDGLLAVYGDHQPSLPEVTAALGPTDRRTDYAIWRAGGSAPVRRDVCADELAMALLSAGGSVDTAPADLSYPRP